MKHKLLINEIDELIGTPLDNPDYILLMGDNKNRKNFLIGLIETSDNKKLDVTLHSGNGTGVSITDSKGQSITTADVMKKFLLEGREDELNYDALSYIQVSGANNSKKLYGIFYSIADMLEWIKEEEEVLYEFATV